MKKNTKPKKQSVKGGASSHLRPCKVAYCDKHNARLDQNPSNKNIRPELSPNNTVWIAPDVPNLVTLDRQIRKDYYVNNNKHMPNRGRSKASPIKESVTLMPDGSKDTDAIHKRITERMEKEFGIRCIRRYNHRDEFCDETGEFNWHGHEVWDMYDHKNHRMFKLTREDCRKWQDIVAEETGMPRGTPAYETRRKWLDANYYKIMKQEEDLQQKREEMNKLDERIRQQKEEEQAKGEHLRQLNAELQVMDERIRQKEEEERARNERLRQLKAEEEALVESIIRQKEDEQASNERISRQKEDEEARGERISQQKEVEKGLDARIQDKKLEMEQRYPSSAILSRAVLDALKDANVKGYKKMDCLALICDHLDFDEHRVISRLLIDNGIRYSLRTSAELEKSRALARGDNANDKGKGWHPKHG